MIYATNYELTPTFGPSGLIDTDLAVVRSHAREIALVLAQHLSTILQHGRIVCDTDKTVEELLLSENDDDVDLGITEVNEELVVNDLGFIAVWEYGDFFELVTHHDVEKWCSEALRVRLRQVRADYHRLIDALNEEWLI